MVVYGFQSRHSMRLHLTAGPRQLKSCGPEARRALPLAHRTNHGKRQRMPLYAQSHFPTKDSRNLNGDRAGMGHRLCAVSESRKEQISDAILGQGKDNDDSWFFTETGQKSMVSLLL